MTSTPRTLLIFDLGDARFALDAMRVRETVWLPELTAVEEAMPYIVGIFSLRGQIVPVIDLNLRFGHPARPYSLSDQIVILEQEQSLMGLIVSEVIEVITVECGIGNEKSGMEIPQLATSILQSTDSPPLNPRSEFHIKAVRVGDDIVTLLDASQLMLPEFPLAETEQSSAAKRFCQQATQEEHAVFHARAKALMETTHEEAAAHLALAVVKLDGEYFGVELHAVQEFCDIVKPSPIPCCPPHILGAISLRGNLLTLLDLSIALNLPRTEQSRGKAIIVRASTWPGSEMGEQAVGVAVDEVCEVVYLRQEELQAAPAALREQHGAEIKGTASYDDRMMTVLDLPALLAREEWIVNETV